MGRSDNNYKLLCMDLDGTMFPLYGEPDQKCMGRLKKLLERNADALVCYVTGRDLELALKAVKRYNLPKPHYLITDVGANIYFRDSNSRWVADLAWNDILSKMWPLNTANRILESVRRIRGIRSQAKSKQAAFKSSFYLSPLRKKSALRELHRKLKEFGAPYTLSISKGKEKYLLLDVLAKGASKKNAVNELREKLGIKTRNTAFAGDSDNDFTLLTTDISTIVVNNATEDLKQKILRKAHKKATAPTLYISNGKYDCCEGNDVCGVLEGLLHFGMFSKIRNGGLYIQIHSIHGLINGKYTDLGRDEDTGGQVVYVVELAKALSKLPGISQIDLITRRMEDRRYPSYSKSLEYINRKFKIVRISCGVKGYVKKTKLWPYISEYVDNVVRYTEEIGRVPNVIHANYADAGLAGAILAKRMDSLLVFTGHSLGVPKMQKLGVNRGNFKSFDRKFNFSKRVKAEQTAMKEADAIVVSTKDELEKQYSGYDIDRKKVSIIPPGIDLHMFNPSSGRESRQPEIFRIVTKSLSDPKKQMILAVSRLDQRKNLEKLVEVFCKSARLRKISNLVIVTGVKNGADSEQKRMLERMKDSVRESDCQNSVSFVKFIDSEGGLAALYHIAKKSRGIFINPAFIEPFGLTVLEASACGLPVIATMHGGPGEIITDNVNGMLIEPKNGRQMEAAIYRLLSERRLWNGISRRAISNATRFGWDETARKEMKLFGELSERKLDEKLVLYLKGESLNQGIA